MKVQVDVAALCSVVIVCGVPYKPTNGLLSEVCLMPYAKGMRACACVRARVR